MRRKIAVLTGIAVSAVVALAGAATPAAAHEYYNSTSNLGSMHVICSTCSIRQGDIVGLWQSVLWADGRLAKCGSAGIDGYFGSGTASATRNWQNIYTGSGTGDGVVGQRTWGRMDDFMLYLGRTIHNEDQWRYDGSAWDYHFDIFRQPDMRWGYNNPANPGRGWPYPRSFNHPGISFSKC